jgi:hypothetical protein
MAFKCDKCGSPNHHTRDCTRPAGQRWEGKALVPVAHEQPEPAQKPAAPEPPKSAVVKCGTYKNPVWKDGPDYCGRTKLPAFADEAGAEAYMKAKCFGLSVVDVWECKECGMWHFHCKAPSPAGDSSGHGRTSKLPTNFKPFTRGQRMPRRDQDLPRAEREAPVELPRGKETSLI